MKNSNRLLVDFEPILERRARRRKLVQLIRYGVYALAFWVAAMSVVNG